MGAEREPPAEQSAAPTLYYLRTFHAVATERSFTRAARQLDLSQPAVSAHIRALEHYYQGRLFEVRNRRVYLTPPGQALFAYTQRVFNLLDQATRTVAATQRGDRGMLRMAASPTLGVYLLPVLLGQFKRDHPDVDIDVAIAPTAEIIASVAADRSPFGLVEAPVSHRDLAVEAIGEDEMILVASRNHPLASRLEIGPLELADIPLVRREAGSGTRALVDAALRQAGSDPPTLMQLGSPEALKQAVLADVGIAWVPRLSVGRELASRELCQVHVKGMSVRRTLSVIHRKDTPLSPLASALLDLVGTSTESATEGERG
jgi:DNA-binding transcriptional LysR family regulator